MEDEGGSKEKASVLKAVKEQMPQGMRVSTETGNLMMECCMEFLRMVSDEANELCSKQGKRNIAPDHIMQSLKELGFEAWASEINKTYDDFKQAMKARPKMGKNPMAKSGLTHEELVRAQNLLLDQAKAFARPAASTSAPAASAGGGGSSGGEVTDKAKDENPAPKEEASIEKSGEGGKIVDGGKKKAEGPPGSEKTSAKRPRDAAS